MKTTPIQDLAIIDVKWLEEKIKDFTFRIDSRIFDRETMNDFKLQRSLLISVQSHLYSLEEAMSDAFDKGVYIKEINFNEKGIAEDKQEYLSQPITLKPL